MKHLLLAAFSLVIISVNAQDISVIPKPVSLQKKTGSFQLSSTTTIVMQDKADRFAVNFLNDYLQKYYGFKLKEVKQPTPSNCIRLSMWNDPQFAEAKESYQLIVDPKFIGITANTNTGTFYGIQSLIQLLPITPSSSAKAANATLNIPAVVIEDAPRFSYRGMHLDVGRHFFPVSFIKQYIDYLALHKFNTFHWHLTEDQGWRIEIKKYPKLTSVGGWRNGTIIGRYPGKGNDSIRYGGFYTQDEIKDVVRYATERFITVIPEIEMPGHSSAAIAAYPELSCFPEEDTKVAKGTAWAGPTKGKQVQQAWGVFDDIFCAGNDNTFTFLQNVLDEVVPLFPSRYIHIGGDEAPKTHWKRCPKCQQRIKYLGLKDEHELQSYFIQRIEKYLNSKGKQIIGWDEILEGGLAPNATVMSWQGEKGGIEAAKQNHNVVMTPGNWCYFDHSQSRNEDSVTIGGYTPVEEVYSYEPQPAVLNTEQARYILGAQANVWTEYMKNTRKVEYQVFPRISAMSEVLWTAKAKRDSADFENRLLTQFKRYDLWKVNYSKAYLTIKTTILPGKNKGAVLVQVFSKKKGEPIYVFDSTTGISEPIRIHSSEGFEVNKSGAINIYSDINNGVSLHFDFNKATGQKITTNLPPSPTYAGNGGAFGLVNGIKTDKFNSTEWLGWNGKPVEITIDLGRSETIKEVILHSWKQEPSWIYLPVSFEVSITDENGQEKKFTAEQPSSGWEDARNLKLQFPPVNARTVKIKVNPLMQIPEGRQGAGKAAWMFLDEIEIN